MKTITVYSTDEGFSQAGLPDGMQIIIMEYFENYHGHSDADLKSEGAKQDDDGDWYYETILIGRSK